MKNKLIKYLISSIFLFFVVMGVIKAEGEVIYVPLQGKVQFIDGTLFKGVDCGEDAEGELQLTHFIVTKTSGGSYKVALNGNNTPNSSTENLTCTYKTHLGDFGTTQRVLDTNGSLSFTFSFTSSVEDTTITANISRNDPILDLRKFLPNFSYVKEKAELDENGQRLDNQCIGDQCYFQATNETFNGESYSVKGSFIYVTSNNQEVNIKLDIYVKTSYYVQASAGDYGVCNFDENIWEVDDSNINGYKLKPDYGGNQIDSIILPSCDASKSKAPAKFYGWTYIDPDNSVQTGQNVMVVNVCKNYPKAEGDIKELIDSGVDKFYTCYETTGSLYLDPANGTIDAQPSWQEQNGKYLIIQDTDFVLPEIKQFPDYLKNDENNKVSYYWQASNDRSKKYKAGDVVTPSGQTFTAIYETDSFIETHLYENSIMYVGDSQLYALTTVKFDTCRTNSPDFVTVSPDGETGGCMMNAIKETPEDQTIEVYGYNAEKDQTYTLNLRILSRLGSTEGGDNEFIIKFDEYAIAGYGQTGEITPKPTKPNPYESGEVTSDPIGAPSCSEYKITKLYTDPDGVPSKGYTGVYKSTIIQFFYDKVSPDPKKVSSSIDKLISKINDQYDPYRKDENGQAILDKNGERIYYPHMLIHHDSFRAKCTSETQDSKSYATVCLDPGASPPVIVKEKLPSEIGIDQKVVDFLYYAINNSKYQSKLVETYPNEDKLVGEGQQIQDLHPNDVANKVRVGVNFVARLINAQTGNLRYYTSTNGNISHYYFGFKYLASNYKDIFNNKQLYWLNGYKAVIQELLTAVDNGIPPADFHETMQKNVETEINGNVITFKGELSLPKITNPSEEKNFDIQGDNVKAKMVCAAGLTCRLKSISQKAFEFDVTFDDPEKLKNMENIKMYLYFKTYNDKRSIVFLDSENLADNTQRMVIFKDEQVYVFKYGGEAKEANCNLTDYPTDPSKFTPEEKQDFMNKNCCQLITNRYDPRYQSFCGDACNKVTYSIACDTDLTYDNLDDQRDYDVYTVNEGFDKKTNTEQIGACVVDVTKAHQNEDDNRISTDGITDAVGNNLVLPDYKDNQYCRVSCKEDWNLKTPGFKNFVGENGAVKAGQYFRLNEEIFLGGTRTCVTTYIDYKHYHDDIKILSGQMVAAYNTYVESKTAYDKAEEHMGHFVEYSNGVATTTHGTNPYIDESNKYTVSLAAGETKEFCDEWSEPDENGNKTCIDSHFETYYTATKKVCPLLNVHTHSGEQTYTGFNNNKDFIGVGTKPIHGESYTTSFSAGADTGWYEYEPSVGSCDYDNGIDTFEEIIDNITYKSKHEEFTSYKNYNRYDGNLPDDVWETPSGTLKSNMDYAKDAMTTIKDDLNGKVKDMGACQNFYMNNTIEDTENYFYGQTSVQPAYKNTGNGYDAGSQKLPITPTEIASPYEPDIRYQYEEYEYMTLVGDNNYLIPDAKENNKVVGEGAQNVCKDTDMVDSNGKTIQLCVNKINTYGYQSDGGWSNKDSNGKTYGGENNKNDGKSNVSNNATTQTMMVCYPDGDNVKCEGGNFYYYELNYIKQTLSNGGYYRNYGDFYTSQYSDIKIFAPSREDAFRQASAAGSNETDWGPLGGNSFPIGIDTRRNIYQYMFSFGNIGIYNDTNNSGNTPTMGRIIGGFSTGTNSSTSTGGESIATSKPAVVADHTHACFYEVYEELCQCCGLPINTIAVMPSKIGNTQDYLDGKGFGYNFSNNNSSSSGTLGFSTSTVSLYDLDGMPNKEDLATNWKADDSFRVYGNTYSTNKGDELADAIVSVGEEIYNREPEYSYTLDPAAMAEIRDYNELHGYEHSIKTMKNIGACAIASDSGECNDTLSDNYTADDTIVFAHYGSTFLEDLDKKYTTEGYKNLSTRDDICSISSGELGSGNTYIDLKNGSYNHCRWVDYVMTKDEAKFKKGDEFIAEMNDVTHFRLAFK